MLCIVAQGPTLVIDAPTSNAVLFMALMYGVELRELQTEVNTPSYLIPQGFSNSRYVDLPRLLWLSIEDMHVFLSPVP